MNRLRRKDASPRKGSGVDFAIMPVGGALILSWPANFARSCPTIRHSAVAASSFRRQFSRRLSDGRLMVVGLLAAVLGLGGVSSVRAADTGTATVPNLKDTLEKGLKARLPGEFGFIAHVVAKVNHGQLPLSLVDSTFLWARNKPNHQCEYFEQGLKLRAGRWGLRCRALLSCAVCEMGSYRRLCCFCSGFWKGRPEIKEPGRVPRHEPVVEAVRPIPPVTKSNNPCCTPIGGASALCDPYRGRRKVFAFRYRRCRPAASTAGSCLPSLSG